MILHETAISVAGLEAEVFAAGEALKRLAAGGDADVVSPELGLSLTLPGGASLQISRRAAVAALAIYLEDKLGQFTALRKRAERELRACAAERRLA